MQQNPSQGIYEYNLDSIYTSGDSNARRERIHFDFVITAGQLERYKARYPGTIDIGDLILCKKDGTSGPALDQPLNSPISIYIDAPTTEEDTFQFFTSRIGLDDQIFTGATVAAWMRGYNGQTLVHLYSKGPYSVSYRDLCGGIAYRTTPEAYVRIQDAGSSSTGGGWNGVCKVGACKCDGTFNTYGRGGWDGESGLTVVYEKCLEGEITWEDVDTSTRPKDYTVPGAVCAPWMSPDVDCEIRITEGLARKYGIYNRIEQARAAGADPSILAISDTLVSRLRFAAAGGTGSDAYFVFEGSSKWLTVNYNDSLAWKSVGDAIGRAVLVDTDVPTAYAKVLSVARGITQATNGPLASLENWIDRYHPLALGNLREVDWYTWDGLQDSSAVYTNPNTDLIIDANSLDEGMVYKVTLHVMNLDPSGGGRDVGINTSATPAKLVLPDSLGGTAMPNFQIQFADSSGSLLPIYGWGLDSQPAGSQSCKFRLHWPIASQPYTNPHGQSLQEISWGTNLFAKYSGKIITLLY